MRNPRGFTLIELLVVIAIIGMLASIIMASLNNARTKGKDAARISAVKSLKLAMELYYSDNGGYPTSAGSADGDVLLSDATIVAALVPKYIPVMPSNLTADADHYYGGGKTSGVAKRYGLYVYTDAAAGFCKTGVDVPASDWGAVPYCNF